MLVLFCCVSVSVSVSVLLSLLLILKLFSLANSSAVVISTPSFGINIYQDLNQGFHYQRGLTKLPFWRNLFPLPVDSQDVCLSNLIKVL